MQTHTCSISWRHVAQRLARADTYFVSIPRLSISLMTSVLNTAVVEKYRSPDETVLVYRSATVYVAATRVMTVRQ